MSTSHKVRSFTLTPIEASSFGAVVTGLKLAKIDAETFSALYDAWLEYALLIFPGQYLKPDEQVTFARRFGPLEFEIAPISNVRRDGSVRTDEDDGVVKVLKGNMGWHCDSTYMPIQAKGAVFSAEIVPTEGGETAWADMRAAYDALSPQIKQKIDGLSAFHSLHYSQGKLGHQARENDEYSGYGFGVTDPPLRPLVKTHPENTNKAYIYV